MDGRVSCSGERDFSGRRSRTTGALLGLNPFSSNRDPTSEIVIIFISKKANRQLKGSPKHYR